VSERFRRGLVVGKFAPLHRGHELLIGRALAACDDVVLISYQSPEIPGYPAALRERWLTTRFPTATVLALTDERLRSILPPGIPAVRIPPNDAPEVEDRRFCGWVCQQVLGVTVDAVFSSEDYGEGFAAELTRWFRERQPDVPAVQHVMVDRARRQVPVSGALLRADVHAHRHLLSPQVYASFVRRVCLLGGESTGKTTLAMALARELDTVWVPEYGREVWTETAGRLELANMERIGRVQVMREDDAALRANRFIFCDTSPLTTRFFSLHLFGRVEPELERLAEREYDLTVVCPPDFGFVQDDIRHGGSFRDQQHAWYLRQLTERGVPFLLAPGPLRERIDLVRAALPASAFPHVPE
jgi:HTH-type transcriptional repressor of NAD biosynthesis genes